MVSEMKTKLANYGGQGSLQPVCSVVGLILQCIKMHGLHNPPGLLLGQAEANGYTPSPCLHSSSHYMRQRAGKMTADRPCSRKQQPTVTFTLGFNQHHFSMAPSDHQGQRDRGWNTVGSFQAREEMPLHLYFYVIFNRAKIRQICIVKFSQAMKGSFFFCVQILIKASN